MKLLHKVEKLKVDIDWNKIQKMKICCLEKGFNGICIPDLIISQNAIQYKCLLWSLDKHFDFIF